MNCYLPKSVGDWSKQHPLSHPGGMWLKLNHQKKVYTAHFVCSL